MGYEFGTGPPHRCSYLAGPCAAGGNSSIEPYIVTHNIILAHATVVRLYREKYQEKYGPAEFGMALETRYFQPSTYTPEDKAAAKRRMDFLTGWNGVNVKGYFYWTPFDAYEWGSGLSSRFGFYLVDFNDNFKRIPKQSAKWLHDFLKGNGTRPC
ncbi:beta-glucosidase 24-like [Fagus crenata]